MPSSNPGASSRRSGKKESRVHHLSRPCQRPARPSSPSSNGHRQHDVPTASGGSTLKICQSSARPRHPLHTAHHSDPSRIQDARPICCRRLAGGAHRSGGHALRRPLARPAHARSNGQSYWSEAFVPFRAYRAPTSAAVMRYLDEQLATAANAGTDRLSAPPCPSAKAKWRAGFVALPISLVDPEEA